MVTASSRPPVVSREEWLSERKRLLEREKALTKLRDELNAERRRLPMVRIEKEYVLEGPEGNVRLIDLFEGRRQLIVHHIMFDPAWDEACPGCSFQADQIPHLAHLWARNTSLILVSRAPMSKIESFRARMGWTAPYYSSFWSDFNFDFHVTTDEAVTTVEYNYMDKATLIEKGHMYHVHGEQPGVSIFLRDGDEVFHTYSTYGRGLEHLLATYHYLDLTPFGRQEEWETSPDGWPKTSGGWVRYHDRYGDATQDRCLERAEP